MCSELNHSLSLEAILLFRFLLAPLFMVSCVALSMTYGLARITDVKGEQPKSQLTHPFPGNWCGVPTIIGQYLIQSVPVYSSLIVLDIVNPTKPVEKSRFALSNSYRPHWTGWDARMQRLISSGSESRLYLNFADRDWPHGEKGSGFPHGAGFLR